MMMHAALFCKCKVDNAIRRTFNEETGLSELIIALILLGVALILGFAFKNQLQDMVQSLWDNLVAGGKHDTDISKVTTTWSWGGDKS